MKLTKTKLKRIIKEELNKLSEFEEREPLDIQTIADDLALADEAWNRMFLLADQAGVDVSELEAAYRALPMAGTISRIELALAPKPAAALRQGIRADGATVPPGGGFDR